MVIFLLKSCFSSYCPLKICPSKKNCNDQGILEIIIARSFKLGQLIEDDE